MIRTFRCRICGHTQDYRVNPATLEPSDVPFFHRCNACRSVHVYERGWSGAHRLYPEQLRLRGVDRLRAGDGDGHALCCDLFVNWFALPKSAAPRPRRQAMPCIVPSARREIPGPNDPGRRAAEKADAHERLTLGRNVVLTDKARAMVARLEVGEQRPLKRFMSYEDMVSAFLVMDGSSDLELNWAVQCRFREAEHQRGSQQPAMREQLTYTHGQPFYP